MNHVSWITDEHSFSKVAGGCSKAFLKLCTVLHRLAVIVSLSSSCLVDFFKISEVFLKV